MPKPTHTRLQQEQETRERFGKFTIVWFYVLLQKDTKMHQLRLFRASFPEFFVNNFDLFRTIITLFMLKVEKELFQVLK